MNKLSTGLKRLKLLLPDGQTDFHILMLVALVVSALVFLPFHGIPLLGMGDDLNAIFGNSRVSTWDRLVTYYSTGNGRIGEHIGLVTLGHLARLWDGPDAFPWLLAHGLCFFIWAFGGLLIFRSLTRYWGLAHTPIALSAYTVLVLLSPSFLVTSSEYVVLIPTYAFSTLAFGLFLRLFLLKSPETSRFFYLKCLALQVIAGVSNEQYMVVSAGVIGVCLLKPGEWKKRGFSMLLTILGMLLCLAVFMLSPGQKSRNSGILQFHWGRITNWLLEPIQSIAFMFHNIWEPAPVGITWLYLMLYGGAVLLIYSLSTDWSRFKIFVQTTAAFYGLALGACFPRLISDYFPARAKVIAGLFAIGTLIVAVEQLIGLFSSRKDMFPSLRRRLPACVLLLGLLLAYPLALVRLAELFSRSETRQLTYKNLRADIRNQKVSGDVFLRGCTYPFDATWGLSVMLGEFSPDTVRIHGNTLDVSETTREALARQHGYYDCTIGIPKFSFVSNEPKPISVTYKQERKNDENLGTIEYYFVISSDITTCRVLAYTNPDLVKSVYSRSVALGEIYFERHPQIQAQFSPLSIKASPGHSQTDLKVSITNQFTEGDLFRGRLLPFNSWANFVQLKGTTPLLKVSIEGSDPAFIGAYSGINMSCWGV